VKVETSELGREGLDDDTKSQPLDSKRNQLCPSKFQIETSNPLHLSSVHDNLRRLRKIDAQIRSTTMKCLRKVSFSFSSTLTTISTFDPQVLQGDRS
jgi:hypothetical protein